MLIKIKFLELLKQDIDNNPNELQTIDPDLINRVKNLTYDIEVNLEEILLDD